MTERYRCYRCGMGFRVQKPRCRHGWNVCSEPKCDLRFWMREVGSGVTVPRAAKRSAIVVGVWPDPRTFEYIETAE